MDNPITAIAVFVIVWWLLLFMILPFGVRPPESEDEMVPGQEPGAPVKPMLWRKLLITTVLTIILWVVFYYISDLGLISFRPD